MLNFADFLYEVVAALFARLTRGKRLKAFALVAVVALVILLLARLILASAAP